MDIQNNKVTAYIKKYKTKAAIISFSVLFLLYFLFYHHGIIKRISVEKELKMTYTELEANRKTTDSLKRIIFKLKTDSLEMERIARENYGMIKPQEEVYYIKHKKDTSTKK